MSKKGKIVVDKMADMCLDNDCSAVMGRVPCKLNNERNEKHQTGAQGAVKTDRSATEKLAGTGLSQLPGKVSIKSF